MPHDRKPWSRSRAWAALLVAAVVWLAQAFAAHDRARDFRLADIEGASVRFSEANRVSPVLLAFWATWCIPCPQELQQLERLHERYAGAGLRILAVAIDGTKTVAKVKPFVKGRGLTFSVLLDTNNDVMRLYQVDAVPSLRLIAPGGAIVFRHTGYKPGDEAGLEREIRAVLGLPALDAGADSSATGAGAPPDSARGAGPEESAR